MATGVVSWSQTAATNSTADANVNFAEGQAPSSVNDSARALMASVAKYRDDNAGSLTTGGTSTAYTLTTNQVFASLSAMSGQSLRVKFNAANGASPTLNVDGLGAKAIHIVTGTAVPTGYIKANSVHDLVYDNSNSCFVVVGSDAEFPSGTRMSFQQTAAPTGWTKDTSSSLNDVSARIVTGAAGTGGSTAFTSVFTSRTIAQGNLPNVNFTVTIAAGQGSHAHTMPSLNATTAAGNSISLSQGSTIGSPVAASTFFQNSAAVTTETLPQMTGTAASGGSGTGLDFAVKYADFIVAAKD